jgi:serine/threonine-protein kinase
MGEVWLALDTRNDREVAIKLLAKQALTDPELQERFRRECKIAAKIWHPHILPVWDYSVQGRPYIVMPFVEDGTDLATILNNGPIESERAVNIVRQIASALDAAHRADLRHRDVKPSNIMVRPDGGDEKALLFDWGIAQPLDTSGAPPVTRLDQLVGTPAYIAPERLSDTVTPDHRADVYSLAVVLFECLAGYKPFEGEDMAVLTAQVLREPSPLPDCIPRPLRDVVTKGLAKNPDTRWQSAGEMGAAAQTALAAAPRKQTRPHADKAPQRPPARVPARTNTPRIMGTAFAGAAAAVLLLALDTVDLTTFWVLLPLLAVGGALVALGVWGPRRTAKVRPDDPTMHPGGFPGLGP